MSHPYLDEELFEELRSILDTEFPTLVRTFVQDSGVRVAELGAAFAEDRTDDVRKAAHSLKGASANLGLARLAEECRELEEAAREDRLAGQSDRFAAVVAERERAVGILLSRI